MVTISWFTAITFLSSVPVGCAQDGGPAATVDTPTSTLIPTVTPTPTPSAIAPRERQESAIKQAILDYNDVLAEISLYPSTDIKRLETVSSGDLLDVSLREYREWRAKGWRATKAVTVENLNVIDITTKDGQWTATASYCGNATGVDVVDQDGKSQVPEDRQNYFPTIVQLIKEPHGVWMPVRQRTKGDACNER